MDNKLTHFDNSGNARMVDVSEKNETARVAIAVSKIRVSKETLCLIEAGKIGKGDVLGVARVAGIMASKQTSNLIPMCHPLMITSCKLLPFPLAVALFHPLVVFGVEVLGADILRAVRVFPEVSQEFYHITPHRAVCNGVAVADADFY